MNSIVYFGFVSNYTKFLFSEVTYEGQYKESVYKYRVIGKEAVLKIYHFLKENYPEDEKLADDSPLKALDPAGSKNFYMAYFIVNTIMLVLGGIIFIFIFENSIILATDKEKYLIPFVSICIITLSLFVIVPYDIMAYFFLLIFALCLFHYLQKNKCIWLILGGISVLVGTLNRETSALSISLIATLCVFKYGISKRSYN